MEATTRARAWWVALGATAALLLSACTGAGEREPVPDGPVPGAELVGSWAQEGPDTGWVAEVMPIPTVVIATEAERDDWLGTLPVDAADPAFEDLRSVDLEESFVVVGGYHRCQESSAIVMDDGEVSFIVVAGDRDIACVWAPYTIDAWAVPLAATDGVAPTGRFASP